MRAMETKCLQNVWPNADNMCHLRFFESFYCSLCSNGVKRRTFLLFSVVP